MRTPEEFTSLAATLLASREPAQSEPSPEIVEQPLERSASEEEIAREVRLFHARMREMLEEAVQTMLCDIAADVLARELRIAPADIARIVDAALQRYASEEPLRVRVHPQECARVRCEAPVVADARLRQGDALIELRSGWVEATLGVRLESVLRAVHA